MTSRTDRRAPRIVVTLSRSGGFAGVTRQWTADSRALPDGDAARLVELVSAADLGAPPAAGSGLRQPPRGGLPDAFSYQLTVKIGRSAHSTSVTDATAGDDVRALIAHVRAVGTLAG